ncbi:hypothetical protein HA466_0119550 [Hirschfeldia incana]|nr:hypothetical protein HA466_0119550 [Hirschfeldia incana]
MRQCSPSDWFLATILMRILKNDFMKYAQDEEAADDQEEILWKYIHGAALDCSLSSSFIVFIILLIVAAFITVALTYFKLSAEDHEWWWRSFVCGGSTGLFIYVYCLYYYYARSDMSGFMQTSFFFGYNLHGLYLLPFLPHAWNCWLPHSSLLRPPYLHVD